jgi:hypothetical protein
MNDKEARDIWCKAAQAFSETTNEYAQRLVRDDSNSPLGLQLGTLSAAISAIAGAVSNG